MLRIVARLRNTAIYKILRRAPEMQEQVLIVCTRTHTRLVVVVGGGGGGGSEPSIFQFLFSHFFFVVCRVRRCLIPL